MPADATEEKAETSGGLPRIGWLRGFAVLLWCLGVSCLVYWPSFDNGFLWDDHALVRLDPLIRSWQLLGDGFRHFLFLDAAAANFYRPIQRLTFLFDYHLYAFAPWGYHLTSILLHGAVAWALWQFILNVGSVLHLAKERLAWPALAAATLWLIHPLHTSAIAYIAGRADPLAFFAMLMAGTVAVRTLTYTGRSAFFGWLALAFWMLIAALSKEAGLLALVIGPLLVALISWRKLIGPLVAASSAFAIYLLLRLNAHSKTLPADARLEADPSSLLRAVSEYAGLLLAPMTLRMERDTRLAEGADTAMIVSHWVLVIAGGLLALGVIALLIWGFRKQRPWAIPGLLAVLTYLPISGLKPLNATMAEHWLYGPSAFLAASLALALAGAPRPFPVRWQRPALVLFLLYAVFLSWRTYTQSGIWRNDRVFFEANLEQGAETSRVYVNLAHVEMNDQNWRKAAAYLELALENPSFRRHARISQGNLAYRLGNYERAMEFYEQAWTDPVSRVKALQNIAQVEWKQQELDPTSRLLQASRLEPDAWPSRRRLVQLLLARGELIWAYQELADFIEREDIRAEPWLLLGGVFERMQRPAMALEAYQRAAGLDVHLDEAREAIQRLEGVSDRTNE